MAGKGGLIIHKFSIVAAITKVCSHHLFPPFLPQRSPGLHEGILNTSSNLSREQGMNYITLRKHILFITLFIAEA